VAAGALWAGEPSPVVKEGRAIRQLIASHNDAWNRRDWNAYASALSEDFDRVSSDGSLEDRGAVTQNVPEGAQVSTSVRQIRFIKPGIAMVDASYDLTGGPDGSRHGQKVYLVEKRNGAWTIVAERTLEGGRMQAAVASSQE
jgi:uncharacterized protein (TIGR02246 family)